MLVPLTNWNNPAKRRLEAIRAAHERNLEGLLELLEAHLVLKGRKRAALSPRTLENYRLAVRDFLAWAWSDTQSLEILKATADDLDRYIADLQLHGGHLENSEGQQLKPGSIATYVAGVRAFYRALEWAGAAVLPQVHSPRDPTPPEERRPALPQGLYQQLLRHLAGGEPQTYRDRLAVRLMAEAGLRISELVNLWVEDIHLEERLLLIRSGKGGKQRSVPLSRSMVQELEGWLKLRLAHAVAGERALLINLGGRKASGQAMTDKTLRKILNRHYRALGFPERYYGAHMLRHTAGTRFYKSSRDLHATARLLGHTNINTSSIYAKMDLEGLFEIVDGLEE
ncbi:tyrosine-type recombinase/integrase [Meiothermus hypogaeus]|uniref:Recombinase XerC n=2 Tax=Meiothermus hypogaeus TaxID=884155 RepID=A0A511QYS1_9DEIN|nr:tyrosine-type recombinase/integrase [Meiothermus hypogaeus]RIH80996.1 Tyrosine recombinase XerC [Meiothermus hypogaeus]GEM82508.1 recombinase XerC [Meiothermus hypogaeus NBRC 106114]